MRRIKTLVLLLLVALLACSLLGCEKKDDEKSSGVTNGNRDKKISADIDSCKTIKTAVEVTLGDERFWTLMTSGEDGVVIEFTPGGTDAFAIKIVGADTEVSFENHSNEETREELIAKLLDNMGGEIPPIQYKEQLDGSKEELAMYYVYLSEEGIIYVYLASAGKTKEDLLADTNRDGIYMIAPEMADEYQGYK